MKRTSLKRIDRLLAGLGLDPAAIDLDELDPPLPLEPDQLPDQSTGRCTKCCYTSQANARKAGNLVKMRGANTSFFRSYFCPTCKAWHLTSSKNLGSQQSTIPNRNAGHKRRNHHQPSSPDEL
jgi:hypothetical protein